MKCTRNPRFPIAARPDGGFSIIELMVAVTVVGMLAAIAVPAMRSFLQNDRQWTQSSSLVQALNAARSESIKRDAAGGVLVCPSTDGLTCNGTSWAQGWVVVPSAPVAGEGPILSVGALPAGTTLTEVNALPQVVYLSNGMVNAAAAFTMCDARGPTFARYTQVTLSGRVASSLGKKLDGTALVCP
jgi:type IV fimbrial biogenesis protein FimT